MIFILLILALMVISTVLVVAAGMLSSRLSRQERRLETFEDTDVAGSNAVPQSVD